MDLAMDGAEAKRRLDLNQVFFVQDVSPKPLMDHLIAQGLLDEETSERVSAKLANEGRTAAARELLDYLKTLVRENARYFHTLLECLKSCHHADLADELQQDLPPVDEELERAKRSAATSVVTGEGANLGGKRCSDGMAGAPPAKSPVLQDTEDFQSTTTHPEQESGPQSRSSYTVAFASSCSTVDRHLDESSASGGNFEVASTRMIVPPAEHDNICPYVDKPHGSTTIRVQNIVLNAKHPLLTQLARRCPSAWKEVARCIMESHTNRRVFDEEDLETIERDNRKCLDCFSVVLKSWIDNAVGPKTTVVLYEALCEAQKRAIAKELFEYKG